MKNIFILYIPPTNYEAIVHYQDTIHTKVSQERIFKYLDHNLKAQLQSIFGNKRIAVWGSGDGPQNRQKYEKMNPGDDVLIVKDKTILLLGKIAAKTKSLQLSKELWKNIKDTASDDDWKLIYFIANPLEINLPFTEFLKLFNYNPNWSLRGLTSVSDERISSFYNSYDDLYSVLQRIKKGEHIIPKEPIMSEIIEKYDMLENTNEETEDSTKIRDHIQMQWKLLSLGHKSGTKVWVPKIDQNIITKYYGDTTFEEEFTAGLDTPAKYVENIDVVWKDGYRIDAAFEVENSTSIYSGLLRFSDLKIVAPNSNYPLFIVAPNSRKNKVWEQLKRPTFQQLEFHRKVRFLSYETINDITNFFASSTEGLNVDVLYGKSESL